MLLAKPVKQKKKTCPVQTQNIFSNCNQVLSHATIEHQVDEMN
jgi:hypothetical protein